MQNGEYRKFNAFLNQVPMEELQEHNALELEQNKKDFEDHKAALSVGVCHYCGNPISHFSVKKPCFHWLLKPKGFKKKHFPLLYAEKSFHEIEAYLRWTANSETPIRNINDLAEERRPSKIIEETIRYKNIEWSFSCSQNDMEGHESAHDGTMPHYHFQMKVNRLVVINYNGFHIPFSDYDDFSFAVKQGKFDRLKAGHIEGAGMQAVLDNFTTEELLNNMRKDPDSSDEEMEFNISTVIMADEGTTISGDDIADIMDESERTGIPFAKLVRKLEKVNVKSVITPGPGVPDIAARKRNR
jgi:hypothetical protein